MSAATASPRRCDGEAVIPVIARCVGDEAIQATPRVLDCFASLAMTAWVDCRQNLNSVVPANVGRASLARDDSGFFGERFASVRQHMPIDFRDHLMILTSFCRRKSNAPTEPARLAEVRTDAILRSRRAGPIASRRIRDSWDRTSAPDRWPSVADAVGPIRRRPPVSRSSRRGMPGMARSALDGAPSGQRLGEHLLR